MTQITQDMVDCWRINYALDKRSPDDAMQWWATHHQGAPAGAVAALGLVLLEREALIAEREHREPLTDEQLRDIAREIAPGQLPRTVLAHWPGLKAFARAVEQAHWIGGNAQAEGHDK